MRKVNTVKCSFRFVPRCNITGKVFCSIFRSVSTFYGTNMSVLKSSDFAECIGAPIVAVAAAVLIVLDNLNCPM